MGDGQAQRRGDEHFRLGCASGGIGVRSGRPHLWPTSAPWAGGLSPGGLLYLEFRGSVVGRRGHSYASAQGRFFRRTANRAASLAHVPWAVHCRRVLFPGTTKSISRCIARIEGVVCARFPAVTIDDFLAGSCLVHKGI